MNRRAFLSRLVGTVAAIAVAPTVLEALPVAPAMPLVVRDVETSISIRYVQRWDVRYDDLMPYVYTPDGA